MSRVRGNTPPVAKCEKHGVAHTKIWKTYGQVWACPKCEELELSREYWDNQEGEKHDG